MRIADFLKANSAVVNSIRKNHILTDDLELLDMYDEATTMLSSGEKTSFVAAAMAEKYGFSERHYYRVMRRLGKALY